MQYQNTQEVRQKVIYCMRHLTDNTTNNPWVILLLVPWIAIRSSQYKVKMIKLMWRDHKFTLSWICWTFSLHFVVNNHYHNKAIIVQVTTMKSPPFSYIYQPYQVTTLPSPNCYIYQYHTAITTNSTVLHRCLSVKTTPPPWPPSSLSWTTNIYATTTTQSTQHWVRW